MRTITKIVFVLLFVSVLLIPISVHATSYSSDDAIAWLQEQEGRSIDYDGYYGAQCVDLIMSYYKYLIGYNVGGDGDDYATNTLPSGWTRTKNGQPQKGDILVYAGGTGAGHIAIYESDNVTWHQNYNGQYVRRVTNKHYTSFVAFDGATYWGCIHPNFNNYVHIKDDSYDTNFKAFPYAKITNDNLFDAGHNKMNANNWIAATDECTILEVYTDGCCKVTYPLDSGGTRTLYSKISLFNIVYDCDHSYTYKSNSSGHWKECTLCGDKQTTSTHTYTNNCDNSCNTCGYTRTTTHTYTNSCDTSCDVCGYTRTTTHTYTNSCDKTCNVCGETRSISHSYGSSYEHNNSKHWQICIVCGTTSSSYYHNYTDDCDAICNSCGYETTPLHNYTYDCDTDCNDCGYIREMIEEHIYLNPTSLDDSTHKVTCRYCNKIDVRQHVYTNDCDTSCNHCKYERTITHSYDNDCDTDCNICGETRSTEHVYDNEQDATCNVCSEVRTVETLPSNSDETEPNTKPGDKPDTDDTQSSSNKKDNNDNNDEDDEDENNDNTTIIVVAIAGAVTVSAVSIFGTALVMKKKK